MVDDRLKWIPPKKKEELIFKQQERQRKNMPKEYEDLMGCDCPMCDGTGIQYVAGVPFQCRRCNGQGFLWKKKPIGRQIA